MLSFETSCWIIKTDHKRAEMALTFLHTTFLFLLLIQSIFFNALMLFLFKFLLWKEAIKRNHGKVDRQRNGMEEDIHWREREEEKRVLKFWESDGSYMWERMRDVYFYISDSSCCFPSLIGNSFRCFPLKRWLTCKISIRVSLEKVTNM